MVKRLRDFVFSGIPLVAVVFLCGVCYYAGATLGSTTPNGKYLVADRASVIFNAVFENPAMSDVDRKSSITDPILRVLKAYADEGYVIIDASKDDSGNHVVAAVPKDTRDITAELAAAVKPKGVKK